MKIGQFYHLREIEETQIYPRKDRHAYKIAHTGCRNGSMFLFSLRLADANHILCTEVYMKRKNHSIKIRIKDTTYWIRYVNFIILNKNVLHQEKLFIPDANSLIERVCNEHELDNFFRMSEKTRRNSDKTRRTIAPPSVQWSAAHPYRGGSFSPK